MGERGGRWNTSPTRITCLPQELNTRHGFKVSGSGCFVLPHDSGLRNPVNFPWMTRCPWMKDLFFVPSQKRIKRLSRSAKTTKRWCSFEENPTKFARQIKINCFTINWLTFPRFMWGLMSTPLWPHSWGSLPEEKRGALLPIESKFPYS